MITEMRRSKRQHDFLPITINAQDGTSGKKLAGPFSARIIDISQHGCRLLISQVLINAYHIFYSTRENDSTILQLVVTFPNQNKQFTVPARPIWLDRFQLDDVRAYTIGVELLTSPEGELIHKLQSQLRKGQKERGDWWAEMDDRLRAHA